MGDAVSVSYLDSHVCAFAQWGQVLMTTIQASINVSTMPTANSLFLSFSVHSSFELRSEAVELSFVNSFAQWS